MPTSDTYVRTHGHIRMRTNRKGDTVPCLEYDAPEDYHFIFTDNQFLNDWTIGFKKDKTVLEIDEECLTFMATEVLYQHSYPGKKFELAYRDFLNYLMENTKINNEK